MKLKVWGITVSDAAIQMLYDFYEQSAKKGALRKKRRKNKMKKAKLRGKLRE